MAKTLAEVIELIDTRLGEYLTAESRQGIVAVRADVIQRIRSTLASRGFPRTLEDRARLSLIPFIFQEANYDGISWGDENEDFGHLQSFFDLDFHVAFAGRERHEVSPAERDAYWTESMAFIDAARASGPQNTVDVLSADVPFLILYIGGGALAVALAHLAAEIGFGFEGPLLGLVAVVFFVAMRILGVRASVLGFVLGLLAILVGALDLTR